MIREGYPQTVEIEKMKYFNYSLQYPSIHAPSLELDEALIAKELELLAYFVLDIVVLSVFQFQSVNKSVHLV